jgi:hypothetical protein
MSTAGIVFLASPLRGSRVASAVRLYQSGRKLLGYQVSAILTKDLDVKTDVLNELVQVFAENVHSPWLLVPGHCFYETKPTRLLKAMLGGIASFLPESTARMVGMSVCDINYQLLTISDR